MINNYHRVRCLLKSDLNNISFVKSFYKITKNLLKNIKLIFYYSLTRFLVNNDYRTKNFVLFCVFWIPQDFFSLFKSEHLETIKWKWKPILKSFHWVNFFMCSWTIERICNMLHLNIVKFLVESDQ